MIKKIFILLCFVLVSNCSLPNSAFLGPVFTGVKTGNIYQTSLSFGSGKIINDIKFKNSLNNFSDKKIINNPALPDIPFVEIDPVIQFAYKIDYVEISDVNEPEPLP